jgi:predicted outer membrane repeat protein
MVAIGEQLFLTVQAALAAAADGDVLTLCPGVYPEGELPVRTSVTLRSASGDPADTVLDADGAGTLLYVEEGALVLEGLTLTGVRAGAPESSWGTVGAVGLLSGPLTFRDCVVEDNEAWYPNVYGTDILVEDSVFRRNSSLGWSAAIAANDGGSLVVSGSTFEDNTGKLGAVYAYTAATLTDTTFVGNSGSTGGAMCLTRGSSLTLTDVVFENNRAEYGGAIYSSDLPVVDATGSTFVGNVATEVGGAVMWSGNLEGRWTGGPSAATPPPRPAP